MHAKRPKLKLSAESFSYDADGNMTANGTLTYEWDGENRLTAAYATSPTTGDKKVRFDYDDMSRRVRKRAYDWTGSAWAKNR